MDLNKLNEFNQALNAQKEKEESQAPSETNKENQEEIPEKKSYNDFFEREVEYVDISLLIPHHNHIFEKLSEEDYKNLKENIEKMSIHEPLLVRKTENEKYEIMAGHNRFNAAKDLNYNEVPCRIATDAVTDIIADEIMVSTNLNRRNKLKPSEIANALKILHECSKKGQGYRSDIFDNNEDSNEKLFGLSKSQIFLYIRISELIPDLLLAVDEKQLSVKSGVNLSFLNKKEQEQVYSVSCSLNIKINEKKSAELRSNLGNLNEEIIIKILSSQKEEPKKEKKKAVKIKQEVISKFFDGKTENEIEDVIEKALIYFYSNQAEQENETK